MLTVVEEWLNSCSGCEIAILNIGDALLDLLPGIQFVHIPVLADHKYYGQLGERTAMDIPEARLGIVSGGVKNSEHLEVLEKVRGRVDILVALGTCATDGGIPAMLNMYDDQQLRDFVYRTSPTTEPGPDPQGQHLPSMRPRCDALDQHVKVDLKLPGCPPHPDWIAAAVVALATGQDVPELPWRSVCDTCPTRRLGTRASQEVKRMLEPVEFDPEKPIKDMRCLMEQGFMCLGPVTRAGCAGKEGVAPRCISARMPCRACYGQVSDSAMPFLDYVGALSALGYDAARMPDKRGYLSRFNASRTIVKKA